MKLRYKIGAIFTALVVAFTTFFGAAPANALSNRLDNFSGRTILMNSGGVYENVPHGAAGWRVTSFRVPAYSCVRVVYRDGWARNYSTSGSYVWIYTRNIDGYLARC